jgi:hypothetical protein
MEQKSIALTFQILQQLNVAKLDYLKAADLQLDSEKKRFLNQQGLLRNRFFQELMSFLRSHDIATDNFMLRNTDFNQRIITTLNGKANDQILKCAEADRSLMEAYHELIEKLPNAEVLQLQLQAIEKTFYQLEAMSIKSPSEGSVSL